MHHEHSSRQTKRTISIIIRFSFVLIPSISFFLRRSNSDPGVPLNRLFFLPPPPRTCRRLFLLASRLQHLLLLSSTRASNHYVARRKKINFQLSILLKKLRTKLKIKNNKKQTQRASFRQVAHSLTAVNLQIHGDAGRRTFGAIFGHLAIAPRTVGVVPLPTPAVVSCRLKLFGVGKLRCLSQDHERWCCALRSEDMLDAACSST